MPPSPSQSGKYRTIVADPPWRTTTGPAGGGMGEGFVGGDGRSRPLAYPTLSLDEIALLPVRSLAEDDAHLWLWTTNGYVTREARIVADAWGFGGGTPTVCVWAKAPMGDGLGGREFGISTEFFLVCRRGSPQVKQRVGTTWFKWKRRYDERGKPLHSAKPDAFYDLVEQVSPGPYLELFARRQRLGWDTYGDEALCHVELGA